MVIISEPRPGLVFPTSVGAVVEEKGVEKAARFLGGRGKNGGKAATSAVMARTKNDVMQNT